MIIVLPLRKNRRNAGAVTIVFIIGDGMKRLLILLIFFVALTGTASAVTWEVAGGCWTAIDGAYSLVKWNATGTHVFDFGSITSIEYLIVGGGGGATYIGGAGAGGVLNGTDLTVSGVETINVGTGGVSGSSSTNGGNSSLTNDGATLIALGGGKGGTYNVNGSVGGSGGGGAHGGQVNKYGGAGTAGQGYKGGDSLYANDPYITAAGGGGAGEAGHDSVSGVITGAGGNGTISSITGTATYYGGGGSGGSARSGATISSGGLGGGGTGDANSDGGVGIDSLGGGGGGGNTPSSSSAKGGSGVVIIKYLTPAVVPVSSFVLTLTDTSTNTPTSWQWNATNLLGNNTEATFSTEQNPVMNFGVGNYLIKLTATNTAGSNSTTKIIGLDLSSPQVYFWSRTS